jgi:hypothetical protein
MPVTPAASRTCADDGTATTARAGRGTPCATWGAAARLCPFVSTRSAILAGERALAAAFDDFGRRDEPRRLALRVGRLTTEAAARHVDVTLIEIPGQVRSTAADLVRASRPELRMTTAWPTLNRSNAHRCRPFVERLLNKSRRRARPSNRSRGRVTSLSPSSSPHPHGRISCGQSHLVRYCPCARRDRDLGHEALPRGAPRPWLCVPRPELPRAG